MIDSLTEAQWAALPGHVDQWIDAASEPVNVAQAEKAIEKVYKVMNIDKPKIELVGGPLEAISFLTSESKYSEEEIKERIFNDIYIAQWWAFWASYYEFGKFIGVKFDEEKYDTFVDFAKNVSVCIPYKELFVLFESPKISWRKQSPNERGCCARILHNENGPSIRYADGYEIYHLNNIMVPPWVVNKYAEAMTKEEILGEENVEVRREIIRKIGPERYIGKIGGEVIDEWEGYELLKVMLHEEVEARYLKMINPSIGCTHIEGVPPDVETVQQALRSRKPKEMRKIKIKEDGADWFQQGDVYIWPKEAKSLKPYPSILT